MSFDRTSPGCTALAVTPLPSSRRARAYVKRDWRPSWHRIRRQLGTGVALKVVEVRANGGRCREGEHAAAPGRGQSVEEEIRQQERSQVIGGEYQLQRIGGDGPARHEGGGAVDENGEAEIDLGGRHQTQSRSASAASSAHTTYPGPRRCALSSSTRRR